jgi:hypothetical protein
MIPTPHTLQHSHVLICYVNIKSLSLHKSDVFLNYNLKTFHILFFNETHFNPQTSSIISFIDSKKQSSISVYAQNGTIYYMTNSQHYHHMKHLPFWELDL